MGQLAALPVYVILLAVCIFLYLGTVGVCCEFCEVRQ